MASETEASCESDPNFAIICAFMEKFGEQCGIESIDFVNLQKMLENNQEVSPELMNLHIKLLRKTKKNVPVERWERALINMCHRFSSKDAWEIERFGYKKTRLPIKLRALKELLEMQFDFNTKFKNEVNKISAESLRAQPLGRDKLGRAYWCQTDNNYQIRIYKEDPDEETWELIAKDREGLLKLITELADGDSKFSSDSACNEDSNSLLEKPFIDTGQNEGPKEVKVDETTQSKKADEKPVEEKADAKETSEKDSKTEEPKQLGTVIEEESSKKVNEKEIIDEQTAEEQKIEQKVGESQEVKRPMLRIKSLSELMETPKEPQKSTFVPEFPELTIIKKPKLDFPGVTIVRKPRMPPRTRPPPLSEIVESRKLSIMSASAGSEDKLDNLKVGEAIQEPVRFFRGEGSGEDCNSGNALDNKYSEGLIIGEEIEEPVVYFIGRGSGVECDTGNEKDEKTVDDGGSKNSTDKNAPAANSSGSDNQVPNALMSNFKLGTIIDSKTENKSFLPRSPTKRSRWDQEPDTEEEQQEHDTSPKKMTFFFGPGSLNVKPTPVVNPSSNKTELEEGMVESLKELANETHLDSGTTGIVVNKKLTETSNDLEQDENGTEKNISECMPDVHLETEDNIEKGESINERISPQTPTLQVEESVAIDSNKLTNENGLLDDEKTQENCKSDVGDNGTIAEEDSNLLVEKSEKLDNNQLRIENEEDSGDGHGGTNGSDTNNESTIEDETKLMIDQECEKTADEVDSNLVTEVDEAKKDSVEHSLGEKLESGGVENIRPEQESFLETEDNNKKRDDNEKELEEDNGISSTNDNMEILEGKSREEDNSKEESNEDLQGNECVKAPEQNRCDEVMVKTICDKTKLEENLEQEILEEEDIHQEKEPIQEDEPIQEEVSQVNEEKASEDNVDLKKGTSNEVESLKGTESVHEHDKGLVVENDVQEEKLKNGSKHKELDGEKQPDKSEKNLEHDKCPKESQAEKCQDDSKVEECAKESSQEERENDTKEECIEESQEECEKKSEEKNDSAVQLKRTTRRGKAVANIPEKEVEVEVTPTRRGRTKRKGTQIKESEDSKMDDTKSAQTPATIESVTNIETPSRATRQTRQPTTDKTPVATQPSKGRGRPKKTSSQAVKSDDAASNDSPVPLEAITIPEADVSSVTLDNPEKDPLSVTDEETTKSAKKAADTSITSFSFDYDPNSPAPDEANKRKNLRKRGRENIENKLDAGETSGKKPKMKMKRAVDVSLRKSVEEKRQQEAGGVSSDENEDNEVSAKKETRPKTAKKMPAKKKSEEPTDNEEAETKTRKKTSKKTRLLKNLGVTEEDLSAIADSPAPVRQSRRLAQIKIKEEAVRRKIDDDESITKKKKKKDDDKDFKAGKRKRIEEEVKPAPTPPMVEKKRGRKKKKHKKISIGWATSSDDSEFSCNDDEEASEYEYEEPHEEEPLLFKSDHEFSPESDLETEEPLPLRRARTARKEESDDEVEEEFPCQKCGKSDHPEWILLCDKCDNGWHCSCLRPALFVIPEGDWYCPTCQHETLLEKLHEKLIEYDKMMVKKGMEDRRKERLAYVGISLNNVLPAKEKKLKKPHESSDTEKSSGGASAWESNSGESSDSDEPIYQLRQRRQAHSYKFQDYDDLINSALQEEPPPPVEKTHTMGRGKDIATIVNAAKEEEERNAEKNGFEDLPPVVPRDAVEMRKKAMSYRKKPKRLNNLEVNSDDDADDSDEDFKGSSSEESEEDDFEEDSDDSYCGKKSSRAVRRSTRARTTRYDTEFINDEDSDDAPTKKKKRRAFVSDSESDVSSDDWRGGKKKLNRSFPKKKSKKKKKSFDDSDLESYRKKKPKIKYGMDSEDDTKTRRTRGKRTSYLDTLGSDSEDEPLKKKTQDKSDDEYVAEEDEENESEDDAFVEKDSENSNVGAKSDSDEAPLNIKKLKINKKRAIIDSEEEEEREVNEEVKEVSDHSQSVETKATAESRIEPIIPEKPEIPGTPPILETKLKGISVKKFDLNPIQDRVEIVQPAPVPLLNVEKLKACGISIKKVNKNETEILENEAPVKLTEIGVKNDLTPFNKHTQNDCLDDIDEHEAEKMMENEDYANRQLRLAAIQIQNSRKMTQNVNLPQNDIMRNTIPNIMNKRMLDHSLRKMRSGKFFKAKPVKDSLAPAPMMNDDDNDELSEPPGVTIPLFTEASSMKNQPPFKLNSMPFCNPPPPPNRAIPVNLQNAADLNLPEVLRNALGPNLSISRTSTQATPVQHSPKMPNLPTNLSMNSCENAPRVPNMSSAPTLTMNTAVPKGNNGPISSNIRPISPGLMTGGSVSMGNSRTNNLSPQNNSNYDGMLKKRRGRGKGKKTLAAEAAAAAAATGTSPQDSSPGKPKPVVANIEIASPPQPFSQSQPAPSVITRMLQSSPGKGPFPVGRIRPKQFAMMSDTDDESSRPAESQGDMSSHPPPPSQPPAHYGPPHPPGQYPPNFYPKDGQPPPHAYHQRPPTMHNYPPHVNQVPPHIEQPQINQPPMSQSPIGQPPMSQPPINQPPIGPPPINQPPIGQPPVTMNAPPVNAQEAAVPSPGQYVGPQPPEKHEYDQMGHQQPYPNQNPPYNYDYNAAAPPPPPVEEEMVEQNFDNPNSYPEQYENQEPKNIEEETGGEFGGLVSYFSSQHEDDLET